jgi:L-galactose dehydrogenase
VSPYYGETLAEQRLGDALIGKRSEIILATKCGRYGVKDFEFSPRTIVSGFDESLRRLKTEYIDLLQVHDVEFGDVEQIIQETLPAFRSLQKLGKARYIGIKGVFLGNTCHDSRLFTG